MGIDKGVFINGSFHPLSFVEMDMLVKDMIQGRRK